MNREHYEALHGSGEYNRVYSSLPDWAVAMNRYHVDLTIALLGLDWRGLPILDLGSGRGHYLTAWEDAGFQCEGIEISESAARNSGRRNIIVGDATDLSVVSRRSYQAIFSAAFLEHVSDAAIGRMLSQALVIAPYQVHFIAHDKGSDEGHINVKPPEEWREFFARQPGYDVLMVPNAWCPVQPAFLLFARHSAKPLAVQHWISVYGGAP